MITIYKNTTTQLQIVDEITPGAWINVLDPTPEEITHMQELGVPHDYLIYSLDQDERAHTERENGDQLILLRIPLFQGSSADMPFTTMPLGIILKSDLVITVCKQPNQILQDFTNGRVRGLATTKHNRFVLTLLLVTATQYLSHLRQITKSVDILEDQLQMSTRNKEVLELLKYQKSLTIFTTALKGNELLLRRLQQSQIFKAYPEDEDLLEDVLTETQQAIEMTNIESSILSGMMDAFASIISNNLNTVMKFLASITIILSLPTMIASFYGMNIDLPLEHHPLAFLIILLVSLFTILMVSFVFIRRDWL